MTSSLDCNNSGISPGPIFSNFMLSRLNMISYDTSFNDEDSQQAEQKSLLTAYNDSLGNSSTYHCGYGTAPLDCFFPEGFLSSSFF